jgi:hypothetical protein
MLSEKKVNLNTISNKKDLWKNLVSLDELRLLKLYTEQKKNPYTEAEHNAWIIKTLVDKKQRYKFNQCKNLVLVGSGLYPYSMFDAHKQYPHIRQVGIEIIESRVKISQHLIKNSPAKDNIMIVHGDAATYDYSWLSDEDFVFISVDVEGEEIFNKVLKTSKAQPLVCAPYKYTWLLNLANYRYS